MNDITPRQLRMAVILTVLVLGALSLLSSALSKRRRSAPRWVNGALVLSSICFLVAAALGFYVLVRGKSLSQPVEWCFTYMKVAIGSFGAGVFVPLLMSSQLTKRTPPET